MDRAAFALFDTAIGRCAIAWCGARVIGFAFSEDSDSDAGTAIVRRWPDAARGASPPDIEAAMDAVRRLLDGAPDDLRFIDVDLDACSPFERAVYAALRDVPPGETITYGELAARCGAPGAARAVGAAMGRNPVPVIVPCHRVLASGGRSGGFSAPGGVTTKLRILQIEGAGRGGGASLFEDLPLAVAPPR